MARLNGRMEELAELAEWQNYGRVYLNWLLVWYYILVCYYETVYSVKLFVWCGSIILCLVMLHKKTPSGQQMSL